jgi:hypothetical protein
MSSLEELEAEARRLIRDVRALGSDTRNRPAMRRFVESTGDVWEQLDLLIAAGEEARRELLLGPPRPELPWWRRMWRRTR